MGRQRIPGEYDNLGSLDERNKMLADSAGNLGLSRLLEALQHLCRG